MRSQIIFSWLKKTTSEAITNFLNPVSRKIGKKRTFGEAVDSQIIDAVEECPQLKLHQLEIKLKQRLLDEIDAIPTKSTIYRHLKENKKVRRRLNRKNIKKYYAKQLKFQEDVSFLKGSRIVAMDEIHYNPKDYLEDYGWTNMGEEAYALQVIIRGKPYAVHAAVTRDGFIAWQIYQHNVDGKTVENFIRNDVAPVFRDDYFLILDNAKNQKTAGVQIAMELNLSGRYFYSPTYSPELNPIEHAFSMIQTCI